MERREKPESSFTRDGEWEGRGVSSEDTKSEKPDGFIKREMDHRPTFFA